MIFYARLRFIPSCKTYPFIWCIYVLFMRWDIWIFEVTFSFQVVGREKGVFWKDLRPKLRAGHTFQTTEFIQRTVRTKFFKYSGRNAMTTYNRVWHRFLRLMNIIHLYQGSIHLPSVSLYVSTFFLAVLNPWQTQAFSLSGFREPSQTGRRTPCGL